MAVLMVMASHFYQGIADPVSSPYAAQLHLARFSQFTQIGQKGVDLFFVLSGFLITGILLRTKGSPHYFKNFYIRRSLRIFPLYFAVVFGGLLVGAIWSLPGLQWHNNWWYLCYLQNVGMVFWPGSVAGPEHFWSLAVEEHFYLFWPLVVLLLDRRKLVVFSLLLIALSVFMRTAFEWWGLNFMFFTLCRMNTLAFGALLAIWFADAQHWRTLASWTRWLVLPVVGITFGVSYAFSETGNLLAAAFKFILFTLLCGAIVVLSLSTERRNPLRWLFQMAWLRRVGKISYAVYVFHEFVFAQILYRFHESNWSPVQNLFWPALGMEFVLAFGLTLLVSQISWVAFEQPILKLKDYFQYEDRFPPPIIEPASAAKPPAS